MNPDMKEKTLLKKVDWLINMMAVEDQNHARWGIISCDVTPQKDLVLGMRNLEKVNILVSNGWVVLPIGTREPLTIACGLLVEQGTINHAR